MRRTNWISRVRSGRAASPAAIVCKTSSGQGRANHRVHAEGNFQTEDEHVFAIGDSALIDQPGDQPAPPTAQAAWQAAEVAGENLARAVRGQPLKTWTHKDKGTVVSVGEKAVAHDVVNMPIETFGGSPRNC